MDISFAIYSFQKQHHKQIVRAVNTMILIKFQETSILAQHQKFSIRLQIDECYPEICQLTKSMISEKKDWRSYIFNFNSKLKHLPIFYL